MAVLRVLLLGVACLLLCLSPSLVSAGDAAADPLTVHLVCHSHDDVGWQITVDEYYDREVRNIINTVTASLAANPQRRFMYVEQAFFQRWWREQNATGRALAQRLVAAKQLEFINGGWCMHDEASTHYVDMVDQTTLGHQYISQQFGVQPTVTWQIDPFGHSATQAALFGPLSGMDAFFTARIDYQDRNIRLQRKELEMVWRASASLGQQAQTFAGAFAPGFGYGPPSGFCWDRGCRNTAIQNNKSAPGYNLDTFVDSFVATAQRQANMTLGQNLMWTMGNDFAWQQAELWYSELDKLIEGVNADGRVKALYSTPSTYLAAKHAEGLTWPLKTDDFFPYADGPDAYWTGYFTSRPALKRYVRATSAFLQVLRHWELIGGASNQSVSQVLWEAQGVAQHHDGVSGTAKQAVTYDYAQRLSVGYDTGNAYLGPTVAASITSQGGALPAFTTCPLLNVSYCQVSQSNGQLTVFLYNPMGRPRTQRVSVPWNASTSVQVFDSTGKAVDGGYQVVMPNLARSLTPGAAAGEVVFNAVNIPPLGFVTYFITSSSQPTAAAAPVSRMASLVRAPFASIAQMLGGGEEGKKEEEAVVEVDRATWQAEQGLDADPTIGNNFWTLTFDGNTGLLKSVTDVASGSVYPLTQNFFYYNGYQVPQEQDSGAYIFRADQSNATAHPAVEQLQNWSFIKGPVTSEFRQVYGSWASQIIRVTAGATPIEFEWTVGHIPVNDGQGKEVITRYSSNIASNGVFFTDSNGREFVQRTRNARPTWQWNATEVTGGNYYPVNAIAWLADNSRGMAVLTDRSEGGSSLQDGALELMIHRRLLHDDGRGVGEPINEPGIDGQGLTVTGTHYLLLSPTAELARRARYHAEEVFLPAQAFLAPLTGTVDAYRQSHLTTASIMPAATGLPPNIGLMTFQMLDAQKGVYLLRLAHQFGVGEDPMMSRPVTVDLSQVINAQIGSVVETSLTANQVRGAHKGYDWTVRGEEGRVAEKGYAPVVQVGAASYNVTIAPAEIRTFNVTLGSGSLEGKRDWWLRL